VVGIVRKSAFFLSFLLILSVSGCGGTIPQDENLLKQNLPIKSNPLGYNYKSPYTEVVARLKLYAKTCLSKRVIKTYAHNNSQTWTDLIPKMKIGQSHTRLTVQRKYGGMVLKLPAEPSDGRYFMVVDINKIDNKTTEAKYYPKHGHWSKWTHMWLIGDLKVCPHPSRK